MSSPKTLIINCGASHVSAAMFTQNSGDLVLEDFVIEELDYDYSIDEEWLDSLMVALRNICHSHKLSGAASLIAPGYQLLTKTIKVPHVDDAKRPQIIAFEAQQNIPYPLTDVVWDNQVIADDGVETEVILIAVKSDVINGFCKEISHTGLTPQAIPAASILDYNSYLLNYQDSQEDTLIVNIGARSSNLIFCNEDGFFIRNIALGGNSLTQNLADSLGKKFSEAEKVKVAYFSGQTSYEADHPSVQILQTNAENFQKRMNQEITRSIVNFRRQHGAKAPTRILLTGRGSLLPDLPDFLRQHQKMEVEYFDPLKNVHVGSKVEEELLADSRISLGEVIGEAARQVLPEPVSINLLPATLAEEMRFAKQRPIIIVAAVLLALATIPPILGFRSTASQYEAATRAIEGKAAPLQNTHRQILSNQDETKKLRDDITNLEDLVNSRSNWIIFFTDLQQRLQDVQDVWLESLELNRVNGNRLDMTGRILITNTEDDQDVSKRVNSLLESFTESDFIVEVDDVILVPASNDPIGEHIREFKFTLIANPERPL